MYTVQPYLLQLKEVVIQIRNYMTIQYCLIRNYMMVQYHQIRKYMMVPLKKGGKGEEGIGRDWRVQGEGGGKFPLAVGFPA